MKFSAALAITLSLAQANATCIDGHREVISPGYTVEYKCDFARLGDPAVTVQSETACAELCRDSGRSGCTYNARKKGCMVGSEGGREVKSPGSILMIQVPEPDDDPFALDCEAEKDACLKREQDLIAQQSILQAEKDKVDTRLKTVMAASCPVQHNRFGFIDKTEFKFWCSRHHEPAGFREEFSGISTLADCAWLCSGRSWCNHVLHGTYQTTCRLYESPKHGVDVTPALNTASWNCAVKK